MCELRCNRSCSRKQDEDNAFPTDNGDGQLLSIAISFCSCKDVKDCIPNTYITPMVQVTRSDFPLYIQSECDIPSDPEVYTEDCYWCSMKVRRIRFGTLVFKQVDLKADKITREDRVIKELSKYNPFKEYAERRHNKYSGCFFQEVPRERCYKRDESRCAKKDEQYIIIQSIEFLKTLYALEKKYKQLKKDRLLEAELHCKHKISILRKLGQDTKSKRLVVGKEKPAETKPILEKPAEPESFSPKDQQGVQPKKTEGETLEKQVLVKAKVRGAKIKKTTITKKRKLSRIRGRRDVGTQTMPETTTVQQLPKSGDETKQGTIYALQAPMSLDEKRHGIITGSDGRRIIQKTSTTTEGRTGRVQPFDQRKIVYEHQPVQPSSLKQHDERRPQVIQETENTAEGGRRHLQRTTTITKQAIQGDVRRALPQREVVHTRGVTQHQQRSALVRGTGIQNDEIRANLEKLNQINKQIRENEKRPLRRAETVTTTTVKRRKMVVRSGSADENAIQGTQQVASGRRPSFDDKKFPLTQDLQNYGRLERPVIDQSPVHSRRIQRTTTIRESPQEATYRELHRRASFDPDDDLLLKRRRVHQRNATIRESPQEVRDRQQPRRASYGNELTSIREKRRRDLTRHASMDDGRALHGRVVRRTTTITKEHAQDHGLSGKISTDKDGRVSRVINDGDEDLEGWQIQRSRKHTSRAHSPQKREHMRTTRYTSLDRESPRSRVLQTTIHATDEKPFSYSDAAKHAQEAQHRRDRSRLTRATDRPGTSAVVRQYSTGGAHSSRSVYPTFTHSDSDIDIDMEPLL